MVREKGNRRVDMIEEIEKKKRVDMIEEKERERVERSREHKRW